MKLTKNIRGADEKIYSVTLERPTFTEYQTFIAGTAALSRKVRAITQTMIELEAKTVPADQLDPHMQTIADLAGKRSEISQKIDAQAYEYVGSHLRAWDFTDDGNPVEATRDNVVARWDVIGWSIYDLLMRLAAGGPGELGNLWPASSGSGLIPPSGDARSAETASPAPTGR